MTGSSEQTVRSQIERLLVDFDAKRPAALARAVSVVENQRRGFDVLLSTLHSRQGRARRIGITGPPGAGKSTISTELVRAWRAEGKRVAVIAVDPTSPFTGGALLGDRIRMEQVALDPGVFIRSMATRGSLGGLSSATRDVCDVIDAFGFDIILIETVGVGQSELDVSRTADSTLVVLVPESGDAIQTLKAGVMEIADIFTVNKADRPGADRLRNDLELMLGLRPGAHAGHDHSAHHGVDLRSLSGDDRERVRDAMNPARAARRAASDITADSWTPPVLRTVGVQREGIEELVSALARHHDYLAESGELQRRRRERLRDRVREAVERKVRTRLWQDPDTVAWLEARLPALESGEQAPFHLADVLLASRSALIAGPQPDRIA